MTRITRLVTVGFFVLVSGSAAAGPFEEVLRLIPVQFQSPVISFTNWARIRADEGLEGLTSQSPLEERQALLRSTITRQAAPSAFGVSRFPLPAEVWGWDTGDHLWEANLALDNFSPLWVIHLAEWVDLDALAERFPDRGFSEEAQWGEVVFRHPLDLTADWLRGTERAILNAAILLEGSVLVMCLSPGGVEAILAARAGVVPAWADVLWAVSLAQLLEQVPPLQPYVGLAVGCETHEGQAVGLLVLHHLTQGRAVADLPVARALAKEGVSVGTRAPFRESVFTGEGAVEGTSVVLRVDLNGQPSRLLSWCTGATRSLPSVLRSANRV